MPAQPDATSIAVALLSAISEAGSDPETERAALRAALVAYSDALTRRYGITTAAEIALEVSMVPMSQELRFAVTRRLHHQPGERR